MENLARAIQKVMKDVKGIDKALTVGSGASSYKGVSDQDVKKVIGEAMERHGLCIIPTSIEPTVRIDRWEEAYNGQTKQKQQVFTEVRTKYLLMHSSGEIMEIAGYGHGVDTQDKSAGKSTTYALKYALLYTFLVPTGKIDDADAEHSDAIEVPRKSAENEPDKWLDVMDKEKNFTRQWLNVLDGIKDGKIKSVADVRKVYKVSKEVAAKIEEQLKAVA